MLRDYDYCVRKGYTAAEYADAWADDLYYQLYESAMEYFWSENYDEADDFEGILTVSDKTEEEVVGMCYEAYKEAFLRYQKDPEDVFEEWEVDDASREGVELIMADLIEQLEELKKYGESN